MKILLFNTKFQNPMCIFTPAAHLDSDWPHFKGQFLFLVAFMLLMALQRGGILHGG